MKNRLLLAILSVTVLGLLWAALTRITTSMLDESRTLPRNTNLRDWGSAPELQNAVWINTERPLRLTDLRGKVVLLEMWTLGCSNCRNVIPTLKTWHTRYRDQGLVIIGNHFPEFAYEKDLENLKKAVADLEIPYPIAQDNEGTTWKSYSSRFWPTLYLIDKRGHIRYTHIGEGNYAQTEAAIQALLDEPAE